MIKSSRMIVSLIVLTLISNQGTDFISISYIREGKEMDYSELCQLYIWTFHKNPMLNNMKSVKILILKGKATYVNRTVSTKLQGIKPWDFLVYMKPWNRNRPRAISSISDVPVAWPSTAKEYKANCYIYFLPLDQS